MPVQTHFHHAIPTCLLLIAVIELQFGFMSLCNLWEHVLNVGFVKNRAGLVTRRGEGLGKGRHAGLHWKIIQAQENGEKWNNKNWVNVEE